MKGNLSKKKDILKQIADAFEPKRKDFETICNQETSDFFFMVNKMNIRHNNCDPKDTKKYCKEFASLTESEKEAWYDRIYEQALSMLIIMKQKERTKEIATFKASLNS